MNPRPTVSRAGWVKYVLLATLTAGAAIGGLYLSGGWPGLAGTRTGADAPPGRPLTHRFLLTALDAKDQVEAPSVAADSAGRVFVAWASRTGKTERSIFLTRTTDGGQSFNAPLMVSKGGVYRSASRTNGKAAGYERRATPHVAINGDRLLLAWSESLPDGSGLRMVLAASADSGATFDLPKTVHRGDGARPTFTALAVGPGQAVTCAWLDDRAGYQQPFAATCPAGRAEFATEQLVHAGQDGQGVCPCCPTAATFGPDGTIFVAFRNIRDGYRDAAVSRKKPGQAAFEEPVLVIPPAWKFDGCPHDGPSLAVASGSLHVVWMDARSGPQRCYYARSGLETLKFEARALHPIPSGSQGNARLFADATGGLHAVWEESLAAETHDAPAGHAHGPPKVGSGGGRAVLYAFMASGKDHFGPARAVAPNPGAFQTRPAIIGTPGGDLFVAWNELDETGKAVVVTRMAGSMRSAQGGLP
jgi:hypothetical protein